MSNKKDLTRIEDLGEFIHELNEEEELPPASDFLSDTNELPDLPESSGSLFGDDFGSTEDLSFGANELTTEEEAPLFTTEETLSDDFSSELATEESSDFTADFTSEETPFQLEEETLQNLKESTSDFNSELNLDEIKREATEIFEAQNLETLEPVSEVSTFKAPENFEDLKKFSESSSFTGMATEGNPSFSVLVKNVRYIEDVNDIIALLRELNLMSDTEEQIKTRLMRGNLLISRISEYAAIYLAHKLRRYDIDIQVGLSDEIHPPKHQEAPETGIVSKHNLYQNQSHHFHFDDPKLELSQIIVAATPSLEGHQVMRYMGVASEHKMLESYIVEDESSDEVPRHYQELAQKLKAHALKAHANAVVGLNYQLTPIPSEFGTSHHKYRLTCTGNLVWVNKL